MLDGPQLIRVEVHWRLRAFKPEPTRTHRGPLDNPLLLVRNGQPKGTRVREVPPEGPERSDEDRSLLPAQVEFHRRETARGKPVAATVRLAPSLDPDASPGERLHVSGELLAHGVVGTVLVSVLPQRRVVDVLAGWEVLRCGVFISLAALAEQQVSRQRESSRRRSLVTVQGTSSPSRHGSIVLLRNASRISPYCIEGSTNSCSNGSCASPSLQRLLVEGN